MEKADTFANRLRMAMQVRNVRQSELSRVSGVARASISSYLSGRYEANSVRTYQLAKALNVDPLWLMGMDTNMDPEEHSIKEAIIRIVETYSEDQLKKLLRFMEEFL